MDLNFHYFSRMSRRSYYNSDYNTAVRTIEQHLKHPDTHSEFAQVVSATPGNNTRDKIDRLADKGFDALFAFYSGVIAGFVAFRRDDLSKTTHIFSVHTTQEYRGNGVAVETLSSVVDDAFASGHVLVQAGKGKNKAMTTVLESFKEKRGGVYIVNTATGSIERNV